MNRPQQEFTFINVTAGKKQNTRAIKRHVSNQTNRRKRQEAVSQYQQSLLQAAEQSSHGHQTLLPSSSSSSSSSPPPPVLSDHADDQPCDGSCTQRKANAADEVISSPEQENDIPEIRAPLHVVRRQPFQIVGYWTRYQQWAIKHIKPTQPPEPYKSRNSDKLERPVAIRKSDKTWKVSSSPARSGITMEEGDQCIIIHIPRIDSPTDQSRMEWSLKTCTNYIRGEYASTWKSLWQDRQWYQGSLLPLGIWRECFPLSVEFIQAGKLQDAFFILNSALSVTPAFFKDNHPGLLIACLGAMMYTCLIADHRLSMLIRTHVTQLSMAHLGAQHPISLLLREQTRVTEVAQGRTDVLAIAVMDTFEEVFGIHHVVPMSMRFGYVRRQLGCGDHEGALQAIENLEKAWNTSVMPGSQLPMFLAFEKSKVLYAQQQPSRPSTLPKSTGASLLETLAESSIKVPVFVAGKGPSLAPTEDAVLKRLGKLLLLGSHYALAFYIYTRIAEVFSSPPDPDQFSTLNQDPDTLPLTVAHILVDHVKNSKQMSPVQSPKSTPGRMEDS